MPDRINSLRFPPGIPARDTARISPVANLDQGAGSLVVSGPQPCANYEQYIGLGCYEYSLYPGVLTLAHMQSCRVAHSGKSGVSRSRLCHAQHVSHSDICSDRPRIHMLHIIYSSAPIHHNLIHPAIPMLLPDAPASLSWHARCTLRIHAIGSETTRQCARLARGDSCKYIEPNIPRLKLTSVASLKLDICLRALCSLQPTIACDDS